MRIAPTTLALPALALLALGGCATIPSPVRSDGFARLGEATRAGPLVVRADEVQEDSRCPMNARCIWAGRVVLAVTVTDAGSTQRRSVTLGEPSLTRDGALVLDSVEPPTRTDVPIRRGDYRFHFRYDPR
ncbi:hypothetical protein OLX02_11105 [Novosphingobium sp. KCTC 2891]|uniref:hypothetical protein n=1 Tax=Novosphingobium sp. KCTC 2891 TaxID=2989730 RepID=UPI0022219F83|nr:hypothetical protein [Novosphingobium sp. KCTC 2891]MCW1383369.1 hypothetical protein [Novosphingobium sp. KCTC 2891]